MSCGSMARGACSVNAWCSRSIIIVIVTDQVIAQYHSQDGTGIEC